MYKIILGAALILTFFIGCGSSEVEENTPICAYNVDTGNIAPAQEYYKTIKDWKHTWGSLGIATKFYKFQNGENDSVVLNVFNN